MKKLMTLLFSLICSFTFSPFIFASGADGEPNKVLITVIIGLVTAVVVAAVFVVVVILKYKMKIGQTNYPLDKFARLDITGSSDQLIKTNITKTEIRTNSNSKK